MYVRLNFPGFSLFFSLLFCFEMYATNHIHEQLHTKKVPNLVMKYLAVEMPKIIEEKMASKKVEADTQVLREENQARYFYAKLKEVRDQQEVRKARNPIRKIRQTMNAAGAVLLDEFEPPPSSDEGSTNTPPRRRERREARREARRARNPIRKIRQKIGGGRGGGSDGSDSPSSDDHSPIPVRGDAKIKN